MIGMPNNPERWELVGAWADEGPAVTPVTAFDCDTVGLCGQMGEVCGSVIAGAYVCLTLLRVACSYDTRDFLPECEPLHSVSPCGMLRRGGGKVEAAKHGKRRGQQGVEAGERERRERAVRRQGAAAG